MIRVVLDTNVLVSALLRANGPEAQVLSLVVGGGALWCVSPAVLAEYGEVLRRPKFSGIPRIYTDALLVLAGRAYTVVPTIPVSASPDEADNRFLECAAAALAGYLVTGNRRHFPPRHQDTMVVNARGFLEAVSHISEDR